MNRRAFSLVELMVLVALIGIIAAIAVPNFVEMQLKAKRSEAPTHVHGITTQLHAYNAAFDHYGKTLHRAPRLRPGKNLVRWDDVENGWVDLGWKPDGDVRGVYEVIVTEVTPGAYTFAVHGYTDIDDDGVETHYQAGEHTLAVELLTAKNVY